MADNFSDFAAHGEQEDNVPGVYRMWKVLSSSFKSEYPTKSAVATGAINQDMVLAMEDFLVPAEYKVVLFTKKWDFELQGARGHQSYRHKAAFEVAGFSSAMVKELMKDRNAAAVYVFEMTDGSFAVVGSSAKGVRMLHSGTSGEFGTGKRGKVITCEEVGFRWPVLPMTEGMKELFLLAAKGYEATYNGTARTLKLGGHPSQSNPALVVDDIRGFRVGHKVRLKGYVGVGVAIPGQAFGTISAIDTGTKTITVAIGFVDAPGNEIVGAGLIIITGQNHAY